MNPGDECTPIYGLPYATGSSDPCNIGSTGCEFAEAVEVQLDALDAIVDRTALTVPLGFMAYSGRQDYNNNQPGAYVPFFDTTLVDTDNMIDFSSDPTLMTIRTAGVYALFMSFEITLQLGLTGAFIHPIVRNSTGTEISSNVSYQVGNVTSSPTMPADSHGARLVNCAMTGEFIMDVPAGATYSFEVTDTGTLGILAFLNRIRAGAVWLRDPL